LTDHVLKLLSLSLLREDDKEVKDTKDEREREKGPDQTASACGVLKK